MSFFQSVNSSLTLTPGILSEERLDFLKDVTKIGNGERGAGSGERGTGNGSLGTSVLR